jgi:hypothetical protein
VRERWAPQNRFPDAVRRSVAAAWRPVAASTLDGPALVKEGCVLPIWRRVFFVGDMNNQFQRPGAPMLYRAAVEAAMLVARRQGRTKVVFGRSGPRTVPVVYVEPGGIVRAIRGELDSAVQVMRMDEFEMRQALAASQGASIMPHNM